MEWSAGGHSSAPELKALTLLVDQSLPENTALDGEEVSGWSIQCLNSTFTGTTIDNVIGQKIVMKTIQLRLTIYPEIMNSGAAHVCSAGWTRCMLVYDAQNSGGNPASSFLAGDYLDDSASVNSFLLMGNRERYRTIMDEKIYTGNYITGAGGLPTIASEKNIGIVDLYKKVEMDTIYNSNFNGNAADITSGALYLLIGTTCFSNGGTGFSMNAVGHSRIRYYDR